jgi:hypothetical protein
MNTLPNIKSVTSPPEFIGHYTIYGPNGYIEAATKALAEELAAKLVAVWPNALSGQPRHQSHLYWRVPIWSKIELTGN